MPHWDPGRNKFLNNWGDSLSEVSRVILSLFEAENHLLKSTFNFGNIILRVCLSFVLNLWGNHSDKNCPINRLTETKTYHLTFAQYLCLLIPTAPCFELSDGRKKCGKFWGKLCSAVSQCALLGTYFKCCQSSNVLNIVISGILDS